MSCTTKKSRVPNNTIAIAILFFLTYMLPIVILTGISCLLSIPYWIWDGIKAWGWSKTE